MTAEATRAKAVYPKPGVKPVVTAMQYKGGGGKTTCLRLIAETMTRRAEQMGEEPPYVIDADTSLGNTEKHLRAVGVTRLQQPLHTFEGWQELANLIAQVSANRTILIDCPGNLAEGLKAYGRTFDLTLAQVGRPWVRVFPINTQQQSVQTIVDMAQLKSLDALTIVIKNGHWGPDTVPFGFWHPRHELQTGERVGGKQREALLDAGGLELYLPGLEASVMAVADEIEGTYDDAAEVMLAKGLIFPAVTLRAWLDDCAVVIDQMLDRLGAGG